MASTGPGTTTVVSQTVAALGRLLVTHIIPLVNSPFPPTAVQLEDAFHALCSVLDEVTYNTPRTPSPLFHTSLGLPEFGEDGGILPTTGTPSSTTVELDHGAEMSPFIAAVQPLLACTVTDPAPEEPGWDFTFITHDVADDTPPARPPSPVSPVHPSTCDFPGPDGDMAMEIHW